VNRCGIPTCGIQQDTQHYTVYIHTNRGIYHPLFIINCAHTGSYISKKEGPERWEIEIDKWTGSASFPAWLKWVELIFADS
jgi:hypothetical protein